MPVYLNESQFGAAADVVGFPHLVVCMGFVALTGNAMYGMHSDVREDVGLLTHNLVAFMAARGVNGANINALYGCGNWRIRYGAVAQELQWQHEMREVAVALGFHGPARGFDTSIIAPTNGTYVEYRPNYAAHTCRIFYKRHEKMAYQTVAHTPVTGFNPDIKLHSPLMVIDLYAETTGATIVPTVGNAGQLHEVDYALRLRNFVIA